MVPEWCLCRYRGLRGDAMIGLGWGSPLHRQLRRAVIRESEIEYLLGRRHDHRNHRVHIRLARAHRTSPGAALLGWAIIAAVVYMLA
jgi:hypothetical protein